jgi:spoIIIJ-associated protein
MRERARVSRAQVAGGLPVVRAERASRVADHAEASARTIEAAVAAAAAQLGLRADQVEVEVLEEPVPSTFGVIGSPARVRVAARPTPTPVAASVPASSPAPTPEGGQREVSRSRVEAPAGPQQARPPRAAGEGDGEPVDEATIAADTELAADFVEGLLDVLDLDGDITTWIDATGGHVDVEGTGLDMLVGVDGEVLAALQELTRLAVLRQTRRRPRVHVDVGGFKARRQQELADMSRATARRVVETGDSERLRPMTPFERKIVHDAVRDVVGVTTESVGEEPQRSVVILPAP